MLADDAEARGARREAAARHEDRIEAAAAAASARAGVLKQLFKSRVSESGGPALIVSLAALSQCRETSTGLDGFVMIIEPTVLSDDQAR